MTVAANMAIGFVALLHAWFLVLEMILWDKPLGRRIFKMTPEFAAASKTLASNQGLYNGFFAAGLAGGLWLLWLRRVLPTNLPVQRDHFSRRAPGHRADRSLRCEQARRIETCGKLPA